MVRTETNESRTGITVRRKTELAAAADDRDGYRGHLPAEPDGRDGGRSRRDHGQDGDRRASIPPNKADELDCNARSPQYATVRALAATCTDPVKVVNGKRLRFDDNENYVGHDEPSVKFISSTPGSGNTMTYLTKIPVDPRPPPPRTAASPTTAQLSVAPWFSAADVRPALLPAGNLHPGQRLQQPERRGSAFLELQFYPPGYTPFIDSTSCSTTKWCAALNIDSLECSANGACNNNCIEPVNFSYLQTNGVPPGPPSPQQTDVSTFTPNGQTLKINGGDVLRVSITDPPQGFTTTIRDLTTHQTGFMTASAANGFIDTSMADCSGTPFTWHAEYSTAKQQNQVPWAALEGGVLMQQEIGHAEVCNSLSNKDPFTFSAGSQSYSDPNVFDTCNGGTEGPGAKGEGPCSATGICQNATTEGPNGPAACPTNDPASGALCEFADGSCFQQGARAATVNGSPVTEFSAANFCLANRFQNGDLDFDGTSYQSFTWPDGSRNHPDVVRLRGPVPGERRDVPADPVRDQRRRCPNPCATPRPGPGCTVPAQGSKFYPFWSLSPQPRRSGRASPRACGTSATSCRSTIQAFGKDGEYGVPDVARFAGTDTSPVMPNPEGVGRCRGLSSRS